MADNTIAMEGALATGASDPNTITQPENQIPMSVKSFTPIDVQKSQMEGAQERADTATAQNQLTQSTEDAADHAKLTAWIKSGKLDMADPSSMADIMASDEFKTGMSPKGQQMLAKAHNDTITANATLADTVDKMNDAEIARFEKAKYQYHPIVDTLLEAYKSGDPVKLEAAKKLAAEQEAAMPPQIDPATGKPSTSPPQHLEGKSQQELQAMSDSMEKMSAAVKEREARAKTKKAEADANRAQQIADATKDKDPQKVLAILQKLRSDPTSDPLEVQEMQRLYDSLTQGKSGAFSRMIELSPEQNAVISKAITDGRLDANRVNSRTAPILANILMKEPGVDLAGKSADIALARQPAWRGKAYLTEKLPEILNNVVEAGKAVNYPNWRTAGVFEKFLKGEVNDKAFTNYMVQRNDALLTIGGLMRGNGMTDKAQEAETEAMHPTLSPDALDSWLKGQMTALKPRLDIIKKVKDGGSATSDTIHKVAEDGKKVAANTTSAGKQISFKAPDSKTYYFKDQAALDAFKKEADIK